MKTQVSAGRALSIPFHERWIWAVRLWYRVRQSSRLEGPRSRGQGDGLLLQEDRHSFIDTMRKTAGFGGRRWSPAESYPISVPASLRRLSRTLWRLEDGRCLQLRGGLLVRFWCTLPSPNRWWTEEEHRADPKELWEGIRYH